MATIRLADEPAIPSESGTSSPEWSEAIPANKRNHLRIWLWVGAIITASTVIIGGITRLTESGLSMVDWDPIIGAIPPLNDADWRVAFDRYKEYPEFLERRPDMTMGEFQFIFFWEYLHRNMGRLLGVVFIVPFIVFWLRGYFNGPLLRRTLLLFVLGGLQGLMGWYMVTSGLVDRPDVSQIRLAAHLLLAVTIFSCCLWFANDLLLRAPARISASSQTWLRQSLVGIGVLLGIQIFWGGLVAGLKAGLSYNTFPLMAGGWLPPSAWGMQPVLLNLIENPGTVQWVHRVLATVLLVAASALAIIVWRRANISAFRSLSAALLGVILLQYGLGVLTLLSGVQIGIAVSHQFVALLTVAVLLTYLHRVLRSGPQVTTLPA